MKKQKEYSLEEAVKSFYKTEPLKTDLAARVADTIFSKGKKSSPVFETWLYAFAVILTIAGIIYGLNYLIQVSVLSGLLIIISIAVYLTLSFKEYSVTAKKLLFKN